MNTKSPTTNRQEPEGHKAPDGSVILPDKNVTPVRDVRDAPSADPQKSEHEPDSTAVKTNKPTPDHKLRRSHL